MKRAGAQALSLLAAPLHVHTLKSLEEGPMGLLDLHRAVGSPPQSTMRVYTRTLEEFQALERRRQNEFPASAEYSITSAGEGLLKVAGVLQEWLMAAPDGPILLGSTAAKSATKALIGGWSSNVVRAVAARALSLTDLNVLIPKISYPTLERKLSAMRITKLVEPQPGEGRGTPYGATEWLRKSVMPVISAAAWERKYVPDSTPPIGRLDVEAAFLLATPLIELDPDVGGRCRLAVEFRGESSPVFAGVVLGIEEGKVVSCTSRLDGDVQASASGTPLAWMREMDGGAPGQLETSGDLSLALTLTNALKALPGVLAYN
ncbi:MAG TPA: winged helix-turn-helix transcriptional regulator [Solirubrobacterales bacterium]|nr:winged helix-turn-helix transcriptional regulator [Solirubrobacterales bacterium]